MVRHARKRCGSLEVPGFLMDALIKKHLFGDAHEFDQDCRELAEALGLMDPENLSKTHNVRCLVKVYEDYAVTRYRTLVVRMDLVESCGRMRLDMIPFTSAVDAILNNLAYENRGVVKLLALWKKWENEND